MKFLIALTIVFSTSLSLASLIEVETFPESPVIFDSDTIGNEGTIFEEKVPGPWFKNQYRINNIGASPIILYKVTYHVLSADVEIIRKTREYMVSEFISVGESYASKFNQYLGGLPRFPEKNTGLSYQYYMEISYIETVNNTWQTHVTPVMNLKH